MRRALALLPFLIVVSSCDDTGARQPGALDPCDTPQAPLLGCPPVPPSDLTIEDACQRLVDCGLIPLNSVDDQGNHVEFDYTGCVNELRGDAYTAERLHYLLHCVEVATCEQLAGDVCTGFGSEP